MIDIFEQALQRNGQAARSRARAIATLCVGGMVLARSIEDRVLADEIRECRNGHRALARTVAAPAVE